jgi:hypothetical protein
MQEPILLGLTILFPVLVTLIPLKWPIIIEIDIRGTRRKKREYTWAVYPVIIFGVLSFLSAIWLGIKTGKDADTVNTKLDSLGTQNRNLINRYDQHAKADTLIGLAFDAKTGKLNVLDTNLLKAILLQPRKEPPPLVIMSRNVATPIFRFVNDTTWGFDIMLQTSNNSVAFNLKDRGVVVEESLGHLSIIGNTTQTGGNENSTLTGQPTHYTLYGTMRTRQMTDTIYVYEKVEYTDEFGKPQKPFIGMYTIDKQTMNGYLPETWQEPYEKVKKLLVDQNKW